ncbi:MAG: N-acetyl-gamma-glutamyl-phosphate reductase [Spirochaetaceae bacterium]|jgi:N-acetyl-gamma-glutamyl-phosphate reductase|nr:N-acetyl-gamma-glutamyl-phosphate reductase [Spirochaetaceae bacterium]
MIAGIIGATGYAGAELVRLLQAHPEVTGLVLASVSHEGEDISSIYPNFLEARFAKTSGILIAPDELVSKADMVFGALPAGAGEAYAKTCMERGISYIDLSADFRFDDDEESYRSWYGKSWLYPELRRRCVYGLPELNRSRISELAASGPVIIGNPGCYPTAVSLACYPAVAGSNRNSGTGSPAGGLQLKAGTIIADAISGVTGAGRDPGRAYHFPECSDSVSPYKVGSHRHTPEINRTIAKMAGHPIHLVFTPHLGPLNRGILATVYFPLEAAARESNAQKTGTPTSNVPDITCCPARTKEVSEKETAVREQYALFYKDEPFVRLLPEGLTAATNRVRQSNYCDISVHLDHSGSVLVVESAIDNMVKGAAGQAVQNMNIICGFNETAGLTALPALF